MFHPFDLFNLFREKDKQKEELSQNPQNIFTWNQNPEQAILGYVYEKNFQKIKNKKEEEGGQQIILKLNKKLIDLGGGNMVDRSKSQLTKKKRGNLMLLVGIISHAKKGKAK